MKDRNVAFVPARSGSKRIPKKNFMSIEGKSIVKVVCEMLAQTELFNEIIVSTDDLSLAQKSIGKIDKVRIVSRENHLATDLATVDQTVYHYFKNELNYDNICCVYPTNYLLKGQTITKSYFEFKLQPNSSLMGISKFNYKIGKAMSLSEDSTLRYLFPEDSGKKTQNLPDYYASNGTFYWTTVSNLITNKSLLTLNQRGYLVNENEVCDLDTFDDLNRLLQKIQFIKI